ncbi:MAG: hypothetical protein Ct9H300mP19_14960 [Dehalococcoidia bacterium]|nr:MAG: hypothetical protein Ct9H300mP19_14960 [Dehalococcoidia bacterium]
MGRGMYGVFDDDEATRAARASYGEGRKPYSTLQLCTVGVTVKNLMGKALKGIRKKRIASHQGCKRVGPR